MTSPTPFDLAAALPSGRLAIEASAGTGKTYALTALVTRYLADGVVGVDELLVVTFTRAAVNELRDRTRATLRRALTVTRGGQVAEPWMSTLLEGDAAVVARRRRRLQRALARFDEATVTTIHGFCQLALIHGGVRSGMDPSARLVEDPTELVAEVCRDVVVRRLADSPYVLSTSDGAAVRSLDKKTRGPKSVETDLVAAVSAVLSHPLARLDPADESAFPAGDLAGDWRVAVEVAVAEIRTRRRVRREVGYDDLVWNLLVAMESPGGEQLAAQLARRFPLVLVDEFQDTDPVQWRIFSAAFGRGRLVTVGDPKQAIYRFRGADLNAYLDAVRGSALSSLVTNYRSDRDLLAAIDVVLNGAQLGHREVSFGRVDAPESAADRSLPGPPLQFHLVPAEAYPSSSKTIPAGLARSIILEDLAQRIDRLLGSGTRPEEIAVLVTSQANASAVAATLRRWGIPTARARTGSVLNTEAATQWRVLLAALASPSRPALVRAAALGWFFGKAPGEVIDDESAELAKVTQSVAAWADLVRTCGIGSAYETMRRFSDVLPRVLAGRDGDRRLADLDQIAELLVTATAGRSAEAHHVRDLLDDLSGDADDQREATMRRVETDADAVQVTTIHAAKGLEYPVVMLPFLYSMKAAADRPYTYAFGKATDGSAARAIDVASWVNWVEDSSSAGTAALRKDLATAEVLGDQQRLLYVAMTRAKHQLHVWWSAVSGAHKSPLSRVLLDRDGAGPILNSAEESPKAGVEAVRARIGELATAARGAISVDDIVLGQRSAGGTTDVTPDAVELSTASIGGRRTLGDPGWRSWSFTAIARGFGDHGGADVVGAFAGGDRPVVGGGDEPIEPADLELPDDVLAGPAPSNTITVPLADIVAGTTFGTMVHSLLERVDFTDPDLTGTLARLAVARARGAGLALDADVLAAGLVAAISTPLGPLFAGRSLRDFAPSERLAEVDFDVALVPDAAIALDGRAIAGVLLDTLAPGDILRSYAEQLRTELRTTKLAGWLNGSIDGVFRVPFRPPGRPHGDAPDHRYVVVDYKTNRLHRRGEADVLGAYRPDRLLAPMTAHHYPLQATLYTVALHRYLGWRLGDRYRPDQHLGGIGYLFVRGMVGPDTPLVDGVAHGVFSYRLPTATVVALDELLARGTRE